MGKDDEWITVPKKEIGGRPRGMGEPSADKAKTGSTATGGSVYKKGLRVGKNVGGSTSSSGVSKKCK
jgi:hypothetical protein